jgi:hypothetical protein
MKTYGGVDVRSHDFLSSALVRREWSASRPEELNCTHSIGDCVGPSTGLADMGKRKFLTLPLLELRPLCRPDRSYWLYILRYPGSTIIIIIIIINQRGHAVA